MPGLSLALLGTGTTQLALKSPTCDNPDIPLSRHPEFPFLLALRCHQRGVEKTQRLPTSELGMVGGGGDERVIHLSRSRFPARV